MLKIEYKRNQTAKHWQQIARLEIEKNCMDDLATPPDFVRGFNNSLKKYPRDSIGRIEWAYKAILVDVNTAQVYWTNHVKQDGNDILIAVITLK